MQRILLTGATGFVGSALLRQFVREGRSVICAVRDPSRVPDVPGVRTIGFDLEYADALAPRALEQVDCVYHLAARVHVMRDAPAQRRDFSRLNANATAALARVAMSAGVRRFVFLSSIKVNGERTGECPFTMESMPAPEDSYGRSKLDAERALLDVSKQSGMEVVVVRPPLVYGPGVGANFRRLMRLVAAGVPLPFASVDNRRSLVGIWNLVSLLVHVGTHPRAYERIWLVSDGEDVSTPQLLRMLGIALGRQARLWSMPLPLLRAVCRALGRAEDLSRLTDSLRVDSSATRTMLDWSPPVGLEEGIMRTVRWYLESTRRG